MINVLIHSADVYTLVKMWVGDARTRLKTLLSLLNVNHVSDAYTIGRNSILPAKVDFPGLYVTGVTVLVTV